MTTADINTLRADIANMAQGMTLILDAVAAQTAIITAMHQELCKDPPPSKIPAALAELTEAVRAVEAAVRDRMQRESANGKA